MKTPLFFAILLATLASHAQTVLICQDSYGDFYRLTREDHSPHAVLQKMDGKMIIASRVGKLQAAGQLNSYFVELSDQNGRFFLVGTDMNSHDPILTGAVDAFGVHRGINCPLPR